MCVVEMPVKVLLTTLMGDTLWQCKVLQTAAPTAKNACHECYVPTRGILEDGENKLRQSYAGYLDGFTLSDDQVDLINATSNMVSFDMHE